MFLRTSSKRASAPGLCGAILVSMSVASPALADGPAGGRDAAPKSDAVGEPGASAMPNDARVYRFYSDDEKRWDVVTEDDATACTLPCSQWVRRNANIRLKADDGEVYGLATQGEDQAPYGVLLADVDQDEPVARTVGLVVGIGGASISVITLGLLIADFQSDGLNLPEASYPPLFALAGVAGVAAAVGFVIAADADGGVRIVPAATPTVDEGRSPQVLVGPATVSTRFPF